MFKRLKVLRNDQNSSIEFAFPLNQVLLTYNEHGAMVSNPKEAMLKYLQKTLLTHPEVDDVNDWTEFYEVYTSSAFFLLNKETIIYFSSEDEFIEHMEEIREKNSLVDDWKTTTINTFYLAYLFYRNTIDTDFMLIKMNFQDLTTEISIKDESSGCILTSLVPLSSYIEGELKDIFKHSDKELSISSLLEEIRGFKVKEQVINYAYYLQNLIEKEDVFSMNEKLLNFLNASNLVFLFEGHIHLKRESESNEVELIRNFKIAKNETENLTLELSCKTGEVIFYNTITYDKELEGNINNLTPSMLNSEMNSETKKTTYTECTMPICLLKLEPAVLKILFSLEKEFKLFIPELQTIFNTKLNRVIFDLTNVTEKMVTDVEDELQTFFALSVEEKHLDESEKVLKALKEAVNHNHSTLIYAVRGE